MSEGAAALPQASTAADVHVVSKDTFTDEYFVAMLKKQNKNAKIISEEKEEKKGRGGKGCSQSRSTSSGGARA